MLTVTLEDVVSWRPCDPPYSRARLEELANGRERISAMEICELDIPNKDKLWTVQRPELIPEIRLWRLSCVWMDHALQAARDAGHEPDKRLSPIRQATCDWIGGKLSWREFRRVQKAAGLALLELPWLEIWRAIEEAECEWGVLEVKKMLREAQEPEPS